MFVDFCINYLFLSGKRKEFMLLFLVIGLCKTRRIVDKKEKFLEDLN